MQDNIANAKILLSIGESSEYLGISIDTLRRWEKKGKLTSLRSPGGHRYFGKEDLDHVFGKKYERTVETKPRNINKSGDVSTNTEVNEASENNKNTNQSAVFNPHSMDFFPTSDIPVFQPVHKEIKIPEIPMIKVAKSEYINMEVTTSKDIVVEQKTVPEVSLPNSQITESVLTPPTQEKSHLEVRSVTQKDAVLSPANTAVDNNFNYLFLTILLLIIIVGIVLTYYLLTIPNVPLSPIP